MKCVRCARLPSSGQEVTWWSQSRGSVPPTRALGVPETRGTCSLCCGEKRAPPIGPVGYVRSGAQSGDGVGWGSGACRLRSRSGLQGEVWAPSTPTSPSERLPTGVHAQVPAASSGPPSLGATQRMQISLHFPNSSRQDGSHQARNFCFQFSKKYSSI